MIANWKTLACGVVGLVLFALLGPPRDSGREDLPDGIELAMHDPVTCGASHSPRCMIDIRYAYPAVDLYVVPDDFYF